MGKNIKYIDVIDFINMFYAPSKFEAMCHVLNLQTCAISGLWTCCLWDFAHA